jgi:hypothetical protein
MGNALKAQVTPGLYNQVRAGFVAQGTSLAAWCSKNAVTRQYAEKCLKFKSNGAHAIALRMRLIEAARTSIDRAA